MHHPVWAVAFRPFFLSASAFGSTAMAAWVLALGGAVQWPLSARWHGHELLYGFFTAVLCGFLLTAAKNWAGLPPVAGGRLLALWATWLFGRLAVLVASLVPSLAPLRFASVAAPTLLFFLLLPFLARKGQEANRVFLAVVAALAAGDAMSLLTAPVPAVPFLHGTNGLWLGLHVSQWAVVLMSGKTMPLFVEKATGRPVRTWAWLERAAPWSVVAVLAADVLDAPAPLLGGACAAAAVTNAVRWWGFRPLDGLRSRLLWLVVLGYGLLVAGYGLLAATTFTGLPPTMVLHVFSAGSLAAAVFAIMSRIALGHTGRPISVPGVVLAGQVLVAAAGLLRAAASLWPTPWYLTLTLAAGAAFALAWAGYAAWSAPLLLRPRADGKPG